MARQASEDDEISRIKKQNKSAAATAAATHPETLEERQPTSTPAPVHSPSGRELPEREVEEQPVRRPAIVR
jgi:tripartite motif-containing protein 71